MDKIVYYTLGISYLCFFVGFLLIYAAGGATCTAEHCHTEIIGAAFAICLISGFLIQILEPIDKKRRSREARERRRQANKLLLERLNRQWIYHHRAKGE